MREVEGFMVEEFDQSLQARFYDELAEKIPSSSFTFMNVGFAEEGEVEDFRWLEPEDLPHKYSINLIRHMLNGLSLSGKSVLDIGCGRGGLCSYLRRYTETREIHGVDLCEGAIEFCRQRYQGLQIDFHQGDAMNLPLADCLFDVATNLESSHCYPDVPRFLGEAFRVLKPGGIFCYADAIFDHRERAQQIVHAGWQVLCSEDFTQQVIRAMQLNEDNLRRFVGQMVDPDLDNEKVIENLLLLGARALKSFTDGTNRFLFWRLQKPEHAVC